MNEMQKLLDNREKELKEIVEQKKKELRLAPKGYLRVCHHGNRTQYYHRLDPKDLNGCYIREKDIKLVHNLAQKDYDKKVLDAALKELDNIRKTKKYCSVECAEDVYQRLHPLRQKLVNPICLTNELFAEKWQSLSYHPKVIVEGIPTFQTRKGEIVRSKSEKIIADTLADENIPYRYEAPLHLNGFGVIHPDFTVLNMRLRKEIYWEHLGMMDDSGYAERAIQRITAYEKNNILLGDRLIITYETRKSPLNQDLINLKIESCLT